MFVNRYRLRDFAGRVGGSRPLRLRARAGRTGWGIRRAALGIEVRGSALYLACLRPGLGRRWVAGTAAIPDFTGLAPEELRSQLRKTLENWGAEDPVVVVGWPRREAIVRHLDLPVAAENALDEALRLQMTSFQPNDDEEFCSDAAAVREGKRIAASLAMLRRAGIEQAAAKFRQAGLPVARMTLTQLALVDLVLRTRPGAGTPDAGTPAQPQPQFFLIHARGAETELAAVEGRALVYSRSLSLPAEPADAAAQLLDAADQAMANLRWTSPVALLVAGALPAAIEPALTKLGPLERLGARLRGAAGEGAEAEEFWGAIALASEGAEWFGPYRVNLLPVPLRARRRHWGYLPTIVLVVVNALLLAALALRGPVERRILLREYRAAIAATETSAGRSQRELGEQRRLTQNLLAMLQFEDQGRRPLDLLADLARKLPSDAWLDFFTCRAGQAEIDGAAKSATAVLSSLQSLPEVEDVKFGGALTRDPAGLEHFRILMQMKGSR